VRITKHKAAIADVLDTVMIGSWQDVAEYESALAMAEYESALAMIDDPEKKKAWIARRLDQRRSSLNNIGRRAIKMAEYLRGQTAEAERAPQQVLASR
jgi:hypothetical protein